MKQGIGVLLVTLISVGFFAKVFGVLKQNLGSRGQVIGPLWLSKKILNENCENPSIEVSASEVAQDMLKLIKSIYVRFLSSDGQTVDYSGIGASEDFSAYLSKTGSLALVDLSQLSDLDRKAFFINIYNALIIHSFVHCRKPKNLIERLTHYSSVSYNIGGIAWSLNDIENGALRGNRCSAAPLSVPPFEREDPRLKLMLKCDPRIHFALNCGAMSCPPIRYYESEKLDQQLDIATRAFVNSMPISAGGDSLLLSQIFKWYRSDFGSSERDVLEWIKPYVINEATRKILETQLRNKSIRCEYEPYNWLLNSKH